MLQHRGHISGFRAPQPGGSVRGAAEQVSAAGAEAAAVDPVTVTRERGERQLREVGRAVHADGLVTRGGGQEGRRESAAAHLLRMMSERDNERHHLVTEL